MGARWLEDTNGERRLTNFLHLAELLQTASSTLDGEQSLIRWLQTEIAEGGAQGDEQVVRLESDADLVKVKKELMGVIEKYFKIEKNRFDITYKRDGELTTLLINSPVIVKRADGTSGPATPGPGNKKDKEKAEAASIPAAANETA